MRRPLSRVPIPSGLLSRPSRALEIRKKAFQVRRHRPNPLALRSHRQQCLFEIEIERQRAREMKRERVLISRRKILHGSGQRENLQMKLDRSRFIFFRGSDRFIRHQQHFVPAETNGPD